MTRISTLLDELPPGVTFDLMPGPDNFPARPRADLAAALRAVPARYQPRCQRACELAGFCRDEARAAGSLDALEDPFILAGLRTAGEAFGGIVVSADPARTTVSARGRVILRPRFTVRTPEPVRIEAGRALTCPARPGQRVKITGLARDGEDSAIVVLEVTSGMGTPSRPRAGAVPGIGEQVTYAPDPEYFAQREFPLPSQTPWTHGGPTQEPLADEPAVEARA
jgi:hypothetical protein